MTTLDLVDTTTRGDAFLDALAGRRVTVMGFAREAAAAVRRLHAAGAHVRRIEPEAPYTDLTGEALVVVTKAAALRAHPVAAARAAGVPVLSELDLAWCATGADACAIAGGRSTATLRMIEVVLAAHGRVPGSLASAEGDVDPDVVLVEPTVDELAAMQVFRPRVAVLLPGAEPIAPRLVAQQSGTECMVLSADDPCAQTLARTSRAHKVWLSIRGPLEHGVYVTRGRIVARLNGRIEDVCAAHGIATMDLEPALVAAACGLWMGLAADTVGAALTRLLALDAFAMPAASRTRVAPEFSVRSRLRGRARALFGYESGEASRETASVSSGAS